MCISSPAHDYNNLRIFNCPMWYYMKKDKLDLRVLEAIFIRYKVGIKGFEQCDPKLKNIMVIHDGSFDEASLIKAKILAREVLKLVKNIPLVVTNDPMSVVQINIIEVDDNCLIVALYGAQESELGMVVWGGVISFGVELNIEQESHGVSIGQNNKIELEEEKDPII